MLTRDQAKVGARVQWFGVGCSKPAFGTITDITKNDEVHIHYDDGEDGSTFIDNAASCVSFVSDK
jgi:hypothetical protein